MAEAVELVREAQVELRRKHGLPERPIGTLQAPLAGTDQEVAGYSFHSERPDVQAVSEHVKRLIQAGHASEQLETCWHKHQFSEGCRRTVRYEDGNPQLHWKEAPPERIRQLIDDELHLTVVSSLGPHIAAVTFVGPWRTRVFLGRDAFFDALEAEFMAYHMYLHSLGDLPVDGFGMWVEYKRDVEPAALLGELASQELREAEARVNDAATCLLFDEYISGDKMHALSRGVLKSALARGVATRPELRAVLRNRIRVREHVQRILTVLYAPIANTVLGDLVRPSLAFSGGAAVMREAWWKPIYLIGLDAQGEPIRRRIPSRKVLTFLGLRIRDIAPISRGQLKRYRYAGLLIEPEEVLATNRVLAESAVALPGYCSARVDDGIADRVDLAVSGAQRSRRLDWNGGDEEGDGA
jgi:hypothetical protein